MSSAVPSMDVNQTSNESVDLIRRSRLFGHILRWIEDCNNHELCRTGKLDSSIRGSPRLLVDVQNYCLVDFAPDRPYVALSYVWGQVTTFRTLQSNVEQLKQPHSLESVHLPRTITDIIELLRHLGQPFLWLDSLCIVQDSTDLSEQILEMAAIYGKAYFTIVPEQGRDADHGIRTFPLFGPSSCTCDYRTCRSNWDERGWTYQESYFSRRKIQLQRELIEWRCQSREYVCRLWYDPEEIVRVDFGSTRDEKSLIASRRQNETNTWPNIHKYRTVAEIFPRRSLTFARDAMDAVASLMMVVAAPYACDFVCCVPHMFLDVVLVWKGCVRRRIDFAFSSSTPSSITLSNPSWSWTAWEGYISLDRSMYTYLTRCEANSELRGIRNDELTTEIVRLVRWYSVNAQKDLKHKSQIGPSFQTYKAMETSTLGSNAAESVPPGWQAQGCEHGVCFVHPSAPGVHFRHPIPMRSPSDPPLNHSRWPYLYCRTRKGYFSIDSEFLHPTQFGWRAILLRTRSTSPTGEFQNEVAFVGAVQPTVPLEDAGKSTFDGPQEFVALSAGSVAVAHGQAMDGASSWSNYPEVQLGRLGTVVPMAGRDVYNFVNVLLVEWKDGVALRRGIGRVRRDVWESHATEEVELLLG